MTTEPNPDEHVRVRYADLVLMHARAEQALAALERVRTLAILAPASVDTDVILAAVEGETL